MVLIPQFAPDFEHFFQATADFFHFLHVAPDFDLVSYGMQPTLKLMATCFVLYPSNQSSISGLASSLLVDKYCPLGHDTVFRPAEGKADSLSLRLHCFSATTLNSNFLTLNL
jgi:hypothetical protein